MTNSINSSDFIDKYKYSPSDFTRKSTFTFPNLFAFLLNSRTSSNQDELDKFFQQINGWEMPERVVTGSALSGARKKLRHEAFIDISGQICHSFYEQYPWKRWLGFRLLAIDGSTLEIDGDPYCERYFGLIDNGGDAPYSLARISQCYDVLNHITVAADISPNAIGERELALTHLQSILNLNDLVILDRGYPGFCFFRQILDSHRNFCARLAVGSWTTITEPFLQSGLKEQIVEYIPGKENIAECHRLGISADPMKLRLVRIELKTGETEILITSLIDNQLYPHNLFEELYHLRWPVEEAYKTLKCRIQIQNFTGTSVLAIKQDFFAKILMFNLTSMLITPVDEKVAEKSSDHKFDYKVNRTEAFRKMKRFGILLFFRNSISDIIRRLHQFFITIPTAIRLNRSFKRKNKRKKLKFPLAYKPIS